MVMKRVKILALPIVLGVLFLTGGTDFAIADSANTVECAPCHGDAHKPGEDNPHGYTTEIIETENITENTIKSSTEINDTQSTSENNATIPTADSLTPNAISTTIVKSYTNKLDVVDSDRKALNGKFYSSDNFYENSSDLYGFYDELDKTMKDIYITLKDYLLQYSKLILDSDLSIAEKTELIDSLYRAVCQDTYNELYNSNEFIGSQIDALLQESFQNDMDTTKGPLYLAEEQGRFLLVRNNCTYLIQRLLTDASIFLTANRTGYKYDNVEYIQTTIDKYQEVLDKETITFESTTEEAVAPNESSSTQDIENESNSDKEIDHTAGHISTTSISSYEIEDFLIPFFAEIEDIDEDEDSVYISFANGNDVIVSIEEIVNTGSMSSYVDSRASTMEAVMESASSPNTIEIENTNEAYYIVGIDTNIIVCDTYIEKTDGSQWRIHLAGFSDDMEAMANSLEDTCKAMKALR